jgi:hypothetical protein
MNIYIRFNIDTWAMGMYIWKIFSTDDNLGCFLTYIL